MLPVEPRMTIRRRKPRNDRRAIEKSKLSRDHVPPRRVAPGQRSVEPLLQPIAEAGGIVRVMQLAGHLVGSVFIRASPLTLAVCFDVSVAEGLRAAYWHTSADCHESARRLSFTGRGRESRRCWTRSRPRGRRRRRCRCGCPGAWGRCRVAGSEGRARGATCCSAGCKCRHACRPD